MLADPPEASLRGWGGSSSIRAHMRVLVNAASLRGYGSGAVGRSILAALGRHPDVRLFAYVPSEWSPPPSVELRRVRAGVLGKLVAENVRLRARARREGDVVFSLGDTSAPRIRLPHLLLVQQAYLAYPPSEWGFVPPPRFRAKLALITGYFRAGLPWVSRITVQSVSMRERLLERWGLSPERVVVVPSAIPQADGAPAPATAAPGEPYVAYVASASPHKNHAVLAEAMAAATIASPGLRCRLTVRPRDVPQLVRRARALGCLGCFDFLGGVSPEEARALLRGAAVAAIPSLLESFGLTYYEAMATGVPIVAADRPFAREACGAAAVYVPPHDGRALGEELAALLRSPARGAALAREGRARLGEVGRSWAEIGDDYLALLRELAGAA